MAILSAIGLGFLINDDILRPLMIVFLLVAILGLAPWHAASRKPMGTDRRNPERGDIVCFIYVSFNEVNSRARHCWPGDCKPVECISATATAEEPTKMTLRYEGETL